MNILVYAGRGVSPECLHHTLRSLRIISGAFYDIKTVSSECLAGEPWEEGCSLLVFPGGRDLPFVEDLQDRATSRIQRYVLERGGKYFGICAGAYFACARVEFERGTALEVIGERDLALCAATAVGCVYPGFEYGGDGGVHAASIRLADAGQRLAVYYNGGCYFDFARDHAETRWPVRFETAAVYADKGDKPAIVVGVQPGQSDASVILTGVHIEYDPAEIECMKPSLPILGELKNSAAERARLWRWVLGRFGLMTSEAQGASRGQPASGLPSPSPTPLFMFFASREQRKKLVAALEGSESYCAGRFESETQTFVVHRDPPCALEELKVTEKECPLVLHSSLPAVQDPSWTFSPETYYSCLEGRAGIGQHLIYAEYVFSTQTFALQYAGPLRCWVTCAFRNSKLTSILPSGTVILAGDQLAGKGRGHNTWLSSKGCLQFTMLLHHQDDPATKLDLALIQYLVGLAVVETIVGEPDYEVRLKWPNDVYTAGGAEDELKKLCGILVNSQSERDGFLLLIGVGINIYDTLWTRSLNECVESHNKEHGTSLPPWSKEQLLARFCGKFAELYERSRTGGFPFELYYKRWMHTGQVVFLEAEQARVRIDGIDSSGHLVVRPHSEGLLGLLSSVPAAAQGAPIRLQPDGNSFDMMKNLIRRKC